MPGISQQAWHCPGCWASQVCRPVNSLVAESGEFNPMEGLAVEGGGEGKRQEK